MSPSNEQSPRYGNENLRATRAINGYRLMVIGGTGAGGWPVGDRRREAEDRRRRPGPERVMP